MINKICHLHRNQPLIVVGLGCFNLSLLPDQRRLEVRLHHVRYTKITKIGEWSRNCSHVTQCTDARIVFCWPLPSNQSFYRQIAGYQRGVGDHRVGQ